jgi:NAD(P)H dehydrogenase (quinone)
VRISAVKANPEGPTDNTRQHGRTEAELRASGLAYVILRPSLFFQNLLGSLSTIVSDGKIYFGIGAGRVGMIDTRDVADAAAAAAMSSKYDGETLELTGPASIDYDTVAAAIGRGLGRNVTYVAVPPAAAGEAMRSFGADDWTAGVVRDYCEAYSKGFGDFTTKEVERLTGHPARSVDDFVRDVLVPSARGQGG